MWNEGWDNIFSQSEWGQYPPEELIRFIARNTNKYQSKVKVLEVGCGTGANLWYMGRHGLKVTGIDGSTIGIDQTKQRLEKEEGIKATLVVGDAMNLPFDNESFDLVIDNECIYCNSFQDSLKIISEVHRVLKKGGKFYSRTFMTGTFGDGLGKKLEGEKNTYTELYDGALRLDYGLIRFTEKSEIPILYGKFSILSIDYVIRSVKQGEKEIKEWIIICNKE